jgi:hypothetical protein
VGEEEEEAKEKEEKEERTGLWGRHLLLGHGDALVPCHEGFVVVLLQVLHQ